MKIVFFFQYIIGCFVIIILTTPFGAEFCNKILRIYGRYYGTYVFKLIWTIKDPPGTNNKIIKTPLVISNHVCWIDTMYLIVTFYPISFLSKSEVAKVPIFGRITTNVQSIYIERNVESQREKIVEDIKERVKKFMEKAKEGLYEKVYPLIIFP
jgi:1-acyl-sn-glycerol-3-phosphate acyltransferase